jgi:hypothetical protein
MSNNNEEKKTEEKPLKKKIIQKNKNNSRFRRLTQRRRHSTGTNSLPIYQLLNHKNTDRSRLSVRARLVPGFFTVNNTRKKRSPKPKPTRPHAPKPSKVRPNRIILHDNSS